MSEIHGVLLDLDGVIFMGDRIIEGALAAIEWLRKKGILYLFVTNTTSRSRSELCRKLERLGIKTSPDSILTPPVAAVAWLEGKATGAQQRIALFAPAAIQEEFVGFDILPESAERGADFVVVGDLAERWDFARLNRAFRLLHAEERPGLLALGMTRFYQQADGVALDVGPFAAALEYATGKRATVLGKPSVDFFLSAATVLGIDPRSLVMIGDDISTDVAGARAAGLRGVLVRTGKFRVDQLDGDIVPDGIIDNVGGISGWWPD